jgi:hypothetical protein
MIRGYHPGRSLHAAADAFNPDPDTFAYPPRLTNMISFNEGIVTPYSLQVEHLRCARLWWKGHGGSGVCGQSW